MFWITNCYPMNWKILRRYWGEFSFNELVTEIYCIELKFFDFWISKGRLRKLKQFNNGIISVFSMSIFKVKEHTKQNIQKLLICPSIYNKKWSKGIQITIIPILFLWGIFSNKYLLYIVFPLKNTYVYVCLLNFCNSWFVEQIVKC